MRYIWNLFNAYIKIFFEIRTAKRSENVLHTNQETSDIDNFKLTLIILNSISAFQIKRSCQYGTEDISKTESKNTDYYALLKCSESDFSWSEKNRVNFHEYRYLSFTFGKVWHISEFSSHFKIANSNQLLHLFHTYRTLETPRLEF